MQIKFGNARFILERGKTALSAFSDGRFAPLAEIVNLCYNGSRGAFLFRGVT